MTYEDFKQKYSKIIEEYELTEEEVRAGYELYREDPQQFHPNMMIPD